MKADALYDLQLINGMSIYPDGDRVVYSVQRVIKKEERKVSALFSYNERSNKTQQLTFGEAFDYYPLISPDGTRLAFLSDRTEKGVLQVYCMSTEGGEARCLTALSGSISQLQWSPDSKKLAYVYRPAYAAKEKPPHGHVAHVSEGSDFYKLDGSGYLPELITQVRVFNFAEEKERQLTSEKVHSVQYFSWHPNSKQIIYTCQDGTAKAAHPSRIRVNILSITGKKSKKISISAAGYWAPVISPDGKKVACIGSAHENYWQRNAELFVFPLAGGRVQSRTRQFDCTMTDMTLGDSLALQGIPLYWSADSSSVFSLASRHGRTFVVQVAAQGAEQVTTVAELDGSVSWFAMDESKKCCWIHFSSLEIPSAIASVTKTASPVIVTKLNKSLLRKQKLGAVEELWLPATKKSPALQGWIYYPDNFNPRKKYPAIIQIHGGPHCQYGRAFFHEFRYLNAAGYIVACCNPRGSQGYGEAYCMSIQGRWGSIDYEDVMRFSRFIKRKPFVRTIGVTGGSYGGFMTNWIVGHSRMFKAAVTQRSISNWVSFYGTCDFNWQTEYLIGEAITPWEHLERYWSLSPLKYVTKVKTPTLVMHSDMDLRCPLEQGEQFYVALKRNGVPTRFVIFPGESHGLSRSGRTDRRVRRLNEIRDWFDKYL